MNINELDTPALLIDLDIMERNLRQMAEYCSANGLRLRPHTKTHKTPAVGRRQLDAGAIGLTVAKVGEAEVMLGAEPPSLLVAYPVIGKCKLARLSQVARQTRLTVSLDSDYAARELSAAADAAKVAVGVLAEVDVGLGRVGVTPGPELIRLVQTIDQLPGLDFEGIAFYPGHIRDSGETGLKAIAALGSLIESMLADLKAAGFEAGVVSGGSTPTWFQSHKLKGLNEIRPGTYIYNDVNTVLSGACKLEDCAVSILLTVVSTSRPGQMIVDGGSKTFSSDGLLAPGDPSFGHLVEDPGCRFFRMNEEHGYVNTAQASRKFQVGERVRIIPNHVCVAVNLHETVYGIRKGEVEEIWKVEGRGKLQ